MEVYSVSTACINPWSLLCFGASSTNILLLSSLDIYTAQCSWSQISINSIPLSTFKESSDCSCWLVEDSSKTLCFILLWIKTRQPEREIKNSSFCFFLRIFFTDHGFRQDKKMQIFSHFCIMISMQSRRMEQRSAMELYILKGFWALMWLFSDSGVKEVRSPQC